MENKGTNQLAYEYMQDLYDASQRFRDRHDMGAYDFDCIALNTLSMGLLSCIANLEAHGVLDEKEFFAHFKEEYKKVKELSQKIKEKDGAG